MLSSYQHHVATSEREPGVAAPGHCQQSQVRNSLSKSSNCCSFTLSQHLLRNSRDHGHARIDLIESQIQTRNVNQL